MSAIDTHGASSIRPIMTAQEAAELLCCSTRTVEDYARSGRLPAVKIGDGWLFPAEAVLRAINKMAEDSAARRATPVKPAAVFRSTARVRPDLSGFA